jgi:hypothetical protein
MNWVSLTIMVSLVLLAYYIADWLDKRDDKLS